MNNKPWILLCLMTYCCVIGMDKRSEESVLVEKVRQYKNVQFNDDVMQRTFDDENNLLIEQFSHSLKTAEQETTQQKNPTIPLTPIRLILASMYDKPEIPQKEIPTIYHEILKNYNIVESVTTKKLAREEA